MNCNGKVLGVNKDMARVLIRPEGCGGCTACHIGSMIDKEPLEVKALNEAGAEKDDLVHLEIPGRKVIEASAVLFMIPFAGFIAGFLIGYYPVWSLIHASRELIALGLGFALLAFSFLLVKYLGEKSNFVYVIKEVVSQENVTPEISVNTKTTESTQPGERSDPNE